MFSIDSNVTTVREHIAGACESAHRNISEITIIAVTKEFPADAVYTAARHDIEDIGENKVQELIAKRNVVNVPVRWHAIGHVQSNKVKYIAPFIHCIHSVDSKTLLNEIQKEAVKNNRVINIMFEINVSQEPQKYGIKPVDARQMAEYASHLSNIHVVGLMTVAEHTKVESVLHEQFATLRHLRDDIIDEKIPNVQPTELSMGMSNDFEIAIIEGATMVRLGTALFGERKKNDIIPA